MLQGIIALFFAQFAGGGIVVPFTKVGLQTFSPALFVFFRFSLAFVLFFPVFLLHKKQNLSIKEYKELFILGFLLFCNVTIFTFGLQFTTAIMSQLLYTLTPIVVGFMAHFFLGERLTKNKIYGLIIALIGVAFLLQQSFIKEQHLSFGTPLGNAIVLIAVLCYSAWILYSRKLNNRKKISSRQMTFFTFGFVSFFLIILNIFLGSFFIQNYNHISPLAILSVFLVGAGNVFSYSLLQVGIKHTNAFTASLFNYFSPLLTAIVSIPLLHEKPTLTLLIGGLLIIFGVFYATSYSSIKRYLIR